jgi:hypothetical protein
MSTCAFTNDDDSNTIKQCVSPTLTQRQVKYISLIALIPEFLIVLLLLLPAYLVQRAALFKSAWIDVVVLLTLIGAAYGINFGFLKAGLLVDRSMT